MTGDPAAYHLGNADAALGQLARHDHPTFGWSALTAAVMALAEEQRTANLIALMELFETGHAMPPDGLWTSILDRLGIRREVRS